MQFPVRLKGAVIHGFKRGSKQLGIPTANLPQDAADAAGEVLETGIYFGVARVAPSETQPDEGDDYATYPMVMSFGWNPVFKNTRRSAEVHLLHEFGRDFYGHELRVLVCGFLRPEQAFAGVDELIAAIHGDIARAREALAAPALQALVGQHRGFLLGADGPTPQP